MVDLPPIKTQGSKAQLVSFIKAHIDRDANGAWYEPFMGSGVVGFNVVPKNAVFADTNPHIVGFYTALQNGEMDGNGVRLFLENEGAKLAQSGAEYYYVVRDRFNQYHAPMDFLFLTRSCFNGLMRFNRNGDFNASFCHIPTRFTRPHIETIVNRVEHVRKLAQKHNWQFVCRDYQSTIAYAKQGDFIYCDPPYIDRNVRYYGGWEDNDEQKLFAMLQSCNCKFMLSTWHSSNGHENEYLKTLWSKYRVVTHQHFYRIAQRDTDRKSVLEALVMNYVRESKQMNFDFEDILC